MRYYFFPIAVIVLAVAAFHGRSVDDGLMLDDNNHRAELHENGWSLRNMVDASHLGGERRRVHMWWQDQADQYFFRPLAFFLMKTEYVICRWHPAPMHIFSLAWTALNCVLVLLLARSVGLSLIWATLAGLLFVVHPANALTTQWIACQNEQMATAFLLAGLICWARRTGWVRWDGSATTPDGPWWAFAALLCFIAALACRETAVVFAPLVILGDYLLRPTRLKSRQSVYALLVLLTLAYFFMRHAALGGFTLLGPPYAYLPSTPGFTRFIFDKFFYYCIGLFAYVPIIGFAGLDAMRSQPTAFYGSFAVVACMWAVLLTWLRPARHIWYMLALATIPLAPVLPVFASAHHLYMASAGAMLAVVMVIHAIWQRVSQFVDSTRRNARAMLAVALSLYLITGAGLNLLFSSSFSGFSALSQLPAIEATELNGPYHPNDRLFFINLPPLGFNCMPAIEERTGVSPLTGYVLTFSSDFLGMNQPSSIERVDDRTLRVRTDGPGYFSGQMGRSMLEAIGRNAPFRQGERFETPDFQVEITRADDAGIQELTFTFPRPLDDPTYHFFFGSSQFVAYPLPFHSTSH